MCRIQPFLVSIAFSCKAVLKATRAGVRSELDPENETVG
jgi:hypothetical protein